MLNVLCTPQRVIGTADEQGRAEELDRKGEPVEAEQVELFFLR